MQNYKLVFFVPVDAAETVKQAVFAAGAGRQGNYQHCCFQSFGKGQFRPLAGANPYIGKVEQLNVVDEMRIEVLCSELDLHAVIAALKAAHPYEEPAYDVIQLVNI